MKKIYLLSSALSLIWTVSADNASAVCVQTPTCSAMGYESSTACEGGLKCPWGNYWNCTNSNKITEIINKITEIEKNISTSNNCQIGDILYSDKSCDPNVIASKKPIGVVFDRTNKLAIGLEETEKHWADNYFDVPGLSNIGSSSAVIADWQGKNNTKVVLEYCKTKGKSCPAFEFVNSYKTEGTIAGDWYLPAFGELYAIYGNKDVLNIALGKIGGRTLGTRNYYWSSSEHSDSYAWYLYFDNGGVSSFYKSGYYYVRPVLAF